MANYEKMYDLFDLAFAMQETSEGLSLEDIEQKYNVSRRTAERMRNALITYFPASIGKPIVNLRSGVSFVSSPSPFETLSVL